MGRAALSQAVDLEAPGRGRTANPQMAECGFVFALSLLVPTVISTAICYSVASTDEGPARPFT